MLVGGVDKVFEIGRVFRNEGLSRKHNPEFTMLEAYEAYGDYESMMDLVESMVKHIAEKVLGTLVIHKSMVKKLETTLSSLVMDLTFLCGDTTKHPKLDEALKHWGKLWRKTIEQSEVALIATEVFTQLNEITPLFPDRVRRSEFGDERLPLIRQELERLSVPPEPIDLRHWRRAKYKDLIRETIHKDWFEISPDERLCYMIALGEEPELFAAKGLNEFATLIQKGESNRALRVKQQLEKLSKQILTVNKPSDIDVTSTLFERFIEPRLIQPTFVTHLPKELVPLAKLSPDDPTTVEVFECCINGQEIAPAYTEQNDPIEQRERLEHQAGGEQQKLDEDFLVALEHGMPPAGGMGMGIDRLCMMLLGQESIRDVILFPQLKPK
jgi:lysyl-tRNA synthetase class II